MSLPARIDKALVWWNASGLGCCDVMRYACRRDVSTNGDGTPYGTHCGRAAWTIATMPAFIAAWQTVPCHYYNGEILGNVAHTYAILAMQAYVLWACRNGIFLYRRCTGVSSSVGFCMGCVLHVSHACVLVSSASGGSNPPFGICTDPHSKPIFNTQALQKPAPVGFLRSRLHPSRAHLN